MSKKSSQSGLLYALGGGLVLISVASMVTFSGGEKVQLLGNEFIEKYNTTENAVMLDVRTPAEFASGHIAPALNLDYENKNFIEEVKKLDPNKTYFVYCRSGNRSGKAIAIMKAQGIKNIYDLKGGIVSNKGINLVTTP